MRHIVHKGKLKDKDPSLVVLFLILAVFLLIGFIGLGKSFLYDWDEGIYAQVAQESGFSPSFYWNGQPWLEKPPLIFWLINFSFLLFGKNEFAARFFMPILGALSLVFTHLLIKERLNNKIGLLALTFLLISPLFLSRSQGLNVDGALLVSIVASLYFLTRLEKKLVDKKTPSFLDYFFPALAISLAILAKGIMGFLPALIWLVYLIFVQGDLLFRSFNVWLVIGLIVIVLVAPWHIYQTIYFGDDFWRVYLIEHIVKRVYQPIEYHFGGKLYYIKFLISEFSWWLLPIVGGGLLWLISWLKNKKADKNFIFFLVWGGLVLGLFTFAKTKLFWYILPLYPVLAVLWGYFWQRVFFYKKELFFVFILLILSLALVQKYQSIIKSDNPVPSSKIALALEAKKDCQAPLLFLVDKNERAAADILPEQLTLSSSFSYGGSPSVVFYFADKVNFFYRIDQFRTQVEAKEPEVCAMITQEDYQNIGFENEVVSRQQEWLLIN